MSTLFIVFKPEYTYLYAFNCIFVEYFYDFVHRIEYSANLRRQDFSAVFLFGRRKKFPEPIHHSDFMFDERVGVAVKRNGRISVPEYFGQRSHVHNAFERAGRKRVAQRVKAAMTDIQFFKHQFETPLVRAHRNDVAVCRHHEVRIAAFLYILQILYQLSGNRYFAAGSRGFGIVE